MVLLVNLLAGCGPEPAGRASSGALPPVAIDMAASTTDAIETIAAEFHRSTGAVVTTSPGASSTLARQIVQGAPVDLFLSASPEWAQFLQERGEVAEQTDLLANRLVVVTPADNPASIHRIADLTRPSVQRFALAEPEHVPAGRYARQALIHRKLWDALRGRVVAADDVRAALAYVARGEVQAGIVYATDAAAAPEVTVVATIDPRLHEPIRYPLVLLRRGRDNPTARKLYAYLQSGPATAVFEKRGFRVLRGSSGARSGLATPRADRR